MKKIKIFNSRDQESRLLQQYIVQKAMDSGPLRILEAGCGRQWPLDLGGVQYTLTGIDLDENALDLRKSKFNDLDEAIVGDLRSIELDEEKYDVIYSSFVLEHIADARSVLSNFRKWLKQDGILILRIPDRDSVFGFITRITPHWVHVQYKKRIRGRRNAGRPGFGPYPTFYDSIISRAGIQDFCRNSGLVIREEYGQGYYLDGRGLVPVLTRLFSQGLSLLSLGRLSWEYSSLTYVIEKKSQPA